MEVLDTGSVSGLLRVEAPAKLNLFLEILGKRADGFHEIETLMVAISIFDTLLVTEDSGDKLRLSCEWASGLAARRTPIRDGSLGDVPRDTDNIVYKAAERFRERAGVQRGARLHLIKRIPSAAGLGGASSDAAAAIWALNKIWRVGWPPERLAGLAAEIGSDVPFFLPATGKGVRAAWCRGRGELIESQCGIPPLHFVVVKPPVGLATAVVYRSCRVPAVAVRSSALQNALQQGDVAQMGRSLHNRLQETAEELCPWVRHLGHLFEAANVWGHQMSGSGTSYFGLCRTARQARQLAARLRSARLPSVSVNPEAGASQTGIGEVFYAATKPA